MKRSEVFKASSALALSQIDPEALCQVGRDHYTPFLSRVTEAGLRRGSLQARSVAKGRTKVSFVTHQ